MGRDMVREAASRIEGFPAGAAPEPGTCDPGASRQARVRLAGRPTTIEALLVSYVDDLDAKMNIVARERVDPQTDDAFTDRVFAWITGGSTRACPKEAPGHRPSRTALRRVDRRQRTAGPGGSDAPPALAEASRSRLEFA